MDSLDSFKCLRPLKVGSKTYAYYSLPAAEKNGLKGISRLPFSLKVLLENLLRNEDGRSVSKEDIQAIAQWLKTKTSERELAFRPARVLMQDFTGVPAVVDLAAMRDAMEHLGGDAKEDQSAGAGGSRHRPFGGGEFLRPQGLVQKERRGGVQAEPGTLPVPQMGAELVRRFPRGAARHRHLPSGQSRISVARGVEREGQDHSSRQVGGDRTRLSGHAGRHRFAHHDGERAVGARLGRRRHRGRGGDARPALLDGAAGGDRRAAERQAQGRRHRDRSRAHGDADAAQARRRRQIRRIFRPRSRQSHHRRPRHDRQHVARIRRDLRLLPGRRRHYPLPARHRPSRRSHRAGHGLRQGAGPVSHQEHARPDVH